MANFNFNQIESLLKQQTEAQAAGWQALTQELGKLSFPAFVERVGGPPHVLTGEPAIFGKPHLDYLDTITRMSEPPYDYHKFHLNKSRQSAWSAFHIYLFAWRGFYKYAGKQCRIIAGTRGPLAAKLITRLRACFVKIPEVVENNGDSMYLELKNGTVYEGLPANPEAATGDTQIFAWLLDESAKWDLKDDSPVMNSIMPLVRSNHADCFMISTPKGPRGFFWELETGKRNEAEWYYYKSNIWAMEGYMYTREEIEKMLADPTMDTAQEYLNQYTIGRASVFGNEFNAGDFEAYDI